MTGACTSRPALAGTTRVVGLAGADEGISSVPGPGPVAAVEMVGACRGSLVAAGSFMALRAIAIGLDFPERLVASSPRTVHPADRKLGATANRERLRPLAD